MAYLLSGTNDYFTGTPPPLHGGAFVAPFTIACWGKVPDGDNKYTAVGIGLDGGSNHRMHLDFEGGADPDNIAWLMRSTSQQKVLTTTAYSVDKWHHACATEAAGNSLRSVYLDGGGKATGTNNRAALGVNLMNIGARHEAAQDYVGDIAEVAIWDIVLTDTEVLWLASHRLSALLMRPERLVLYVPLDGKGTDAVDLIKGRRFTRVGTVLPSPHPPIVYPRRKRTYFVPATVTTKAGVVRRRQARPSYSPNYATGSRDFVPSSDYLDVLRPILTAAPFTVAGWVYVDAIAGTNHNVWSLGDAGDSAQTWIVQFRSNSKVRFFASSSSAETTTTYSQAAWHHFCAIEVSPTDRKIYLDGGGVGTNTTSRVPANVDKHVIGTYFNGGSPSQGINGKLSEFGMWNRALSEAEIVSLAQGNSPLFIPNGRIFYAPLDDRRDEAVVRNGIARMTPVNSPLFSSLHPLVVRPRRSRIAFVVPGVEVGGLSVPVAMHYYRQRRVS